MHETYLLYFDAFCAIGLHPDRKNIVVNGSIGFSHTKGMKTAITMFDVDTVHCTLTEYGLVRHHMLVKDMDKYVSFIKVNL